MLAKTNGSNHRIATTSERDKTKQKMPTIVIAEKATNPPPVSSAFDPAVVKLAETAVKDKAWYVLPDDENGRYTLSIIRRYLAETKKVRVQSKTRGDQIFWHVLDEAPMVRGSHKVTAATATKKVGNSIG